MTIFEFEMNYWEYTHDDTEGEGEGVGVGLGGGVGVWETLVWRLEI